MSVVPCCPPAPMGQQAPPTRATAFDSWRSLRAARGPLLLTTGTGYPTLAAEPPEKSACVENLTHMPVA
jgi:hypothetical protein